jgi:NAD(P)-dependent dehydrogenase (short-subunit alcohol dehydrogenase family)
MTDKRFDVAGRVVIVTGGASGIGRVYCEALVAAGARAVLADLDGAQAEVAAKALSADGGQALGAACDVSDAASVQAMVDAAVKHFGRIDGLVNNAALMSTLPRGPWHAIEESDWDRVMGVNLRGLFLCSRAVYPHMQKAGAGRIVNISSNRVWEGTPNRLHYTTSKAGVIGFTRALSREVGDDNITVNAITPGFTASETQVGGSDPAYMARMAILNERKALKRTQMPDDLVGALLFLLSDASAYITGQTINVDGGAMMH